MKSNKAFLHLASIPPKQFRTSDLSEESKIKVKDTVKYALSANDENDVSSILKRCVVAQLAEQYVAEWMEGHVMHGEEDTSDPWTYAFDVLSGPKYYGMRIEVKTHQSESKYITVNTGHVQPFPGKTGLNIRPFIEQKLADLIIVFNIIENVDGWIIEPFLLSDRDSLMHKDIILKSKFDGFYINKFVKTVTKNMLNIVYF